MPEVSARQRRLATIRQLRERVRVQAGDRQAAPPETPAARIWTDEPPGRIGRPRRPGNRPSCHGVDAEAVVDVLERADVVLVPGTFHAEVANALWKHVRAESVDLPDAIWRIESAVALADRTVPDAGLAEEAMIAAAGTGHPVYDMLYAVLARRFGCTVCTMDKRLGAALEKMDIAQLTLRP